MKKLLMLYLREKRSAINRRPRKTKRTNKQAKDRVFRLSAIAQTTLNDRIIALSKCFSRMLQCIPIQNFFGRLKIIVKLIKDKSKVKGDPYHN
jgi:hypothetical protein